MQAAALVHRLLEGDEEDDLIPDLKSYVLLHGGYEKGVVSWNGQDYPIVIKSYTQADGSGDIKYFGLKAPNGDWGWWPFAALRNPNWGFGNDTIPHQLNRPVREWVRQRGLLESEDDDLIPNPKAYANKFGVPHKLEYDPKTGLTNVYSGDLFYLGSYDETPSHWRAFQLRQVNTAWPVKSLPRGFSKLDSLIKYLKMLREFGYPDGEDRFFALQESEDDDLSAKQIVTHYAGFNTDQMIHWVKARLPFELEIEVFHRRKDAAIDSEYFQIEVSRKRVSETGQLLPVPWTMSDLGKTERAIKAFGQLTGYYMPGFGRDRCHDDDRYWFSFHAIHKSAGPTKLNYRKRTQREINAWYNRRERRLPEDQ